MDEVRIESKPAAAATSWVIQRRIRKKIGDNVKVQLNNFKASVINEKTCVHLDVDLEFGKEELDKLLESIGL